MEDSREKITKNLLDKDKKISHLEGIIQQLEDHIKKLNKVEECSYGNSIDLKEEISRLNKVVMDKEDKLAQLHEKLENQEIELCHRQHQKEKFQQKYDDNKKIHKLELTKVNNVLSSNTEEIFRLRNHNKTLIRKIKKLRHVSKRKHSSEDLEGRILEKHEKNQCLNNRNQELQNQIKEL